MVKNSSREIILSRLKSVKNHGWEYNPEIIQGSGNGFNKPEDLSGSFLERFNTVGGKGFIIDGVNEFVEKIKELNLQFGWKNIYCQVADLRKLLAQCGVKIFSEEPEKGSNWVAITSCICLISQTGSIMVSSISGRGRKVFVSPHTHIVYAGLRQMVPYITDGFDLANKSGNPSWIGLITGPSRTADIEKTLVLGAHGPKDLFVFIDKSK